MDFSSIFGKKTKETKHDDDFVDMSVMEKQIAEGKAMPGPAAQKSAKQAQPNPAPAKPAVNPNKNKYICSRCGYKFSLDKAQYKKVECPWCGTQQQIQ